MPIEGEITVDGQEDLQDTEVPRAPSTQVPATGRLAGLCARLNSLRPYRRARYALFKLRTVHFSSGLLLAAASRVSPRVSQWMNSSNRYAQWYSRFVERRIAGTQFFHTIDVETTNVCNAKCVFCPYPIMTRAKYSMKDDEYLRIIRKIATHPHKPKTLCFSFFGEPFVDKALCGRIRSARRELGRSVVLSVTTNGSLIRGETINDVLTSGIDIVNISFNGLDKTDYENSMKLRFDITDQNVRKLLAARRSRGLLRPYIHIGCVMHSGNAGMEVASFLAKWKTAGADTVAVYPMNKHHEIIQVGAHPKLAKKDSRYYPCRSLWTDCVIASSGDISICCIDYDGKYKLGNVFEDDWTTLFNNSQRRAYQDLHRANRAGEIGICSNCDSPRSNSAWLV